MVGRELEGRAGGAGEERREAGCVGVCKGAGEGVICICV